MADTTDTGGPAFPQPIAVTPDGCVEHARDTQGMAGMDLLDYFAAKAMQASLAHAFHRAFEGLSDDEYAALVAQTSYRYGRAMLKERAK